MKTIATDSSGRHIDIEELAKFYRQTFGCPVGAQVLMHLSHQLYAGKTTWHPDSREHARQEGMHQAWLLINQFLNYSPEQVAKMYRGIPILLTPEEDTDG